MKCSVKQRGKFFIVVDPFHHKSYTLNNRLGAESLAVTLNKVTGLETLLEKSKEELTKVNGLHAFDKCCSQLGYVEVFDNDIIELDYSELISEIGQVMWND